MRPSDGWCNNSTPRPSQKDFLGKSRLCWVSWLVVFQASLFDKLSHRYEAYVQPMVGIFCFNKMEKWKHIQAALGWLVEWVGSQLQLLRVDPKPCLEVHDFWTEVVHARGFGGSQYLPWIKRLLFLLGPVPMVFSQIHNFKKNNLQKSDFACFNNTLQQHMIICWDGHATYGASEGTSCWTVTDFTDCGSQEKDRSLECINWRMRNKQVKIYPSNFIDYTGWFGSDPH